MHDESTASSSADPNHDLQLVTLVEAARYLAVSRSALYAILATGQLASVHIGRARRIPMGELQRFVRQRLSA